MTSVESIVESTSITNSVTSIVTTPKRSDGGTTVKTSNSKRISSISCSLRFVIIGGFTTLSFEFAFRQHHSVIECWTTHTRSRAASTITATITFTQSFLHFQHHNRLRGTLQVYGTVTVIQSIVKTTSVTDQGAIGSSSPEWGFGGMTIQALLGAGGRFRCQRVHVGSRAIIIH